MPITIRNFDVEEEKDERAIIDRRDQKIIVFILLETLPVRPRTQ